MLSFWEKVSKGTVILPPEATLPDGTEIRMEPVPSTRTLAQRLSDVITVRGGPPDRAENHDHYIHGTPKK